MFERYTDRARRVVVLAQEQARDINHNYIGTEHLLLGMLAEAEGIAALTLGDLGVEFDAMRDGVLSIVGKGTSAPDGHIPFTPRAKKVCELSLREALHLSCNYIGTEHLLLGLVREGEGVACRALSAFGGVTPAVVREAVLLRLGVYQAQAQREEQARSQTLLPCLCGHVYGHHASLTAAIYRHCNWRGCGCPQFIVCDPQRDAVMGKHREPVANECGNPTASQPITDASGGA